MSWTVEIELNDNLQPEGERKLIHRIGKIALYSRFITRMGYPVFEVTYDGVELPFTLRSPEEALKAAKVFLESTHTRRKKRPKPQFLANNGAILGIRAWRISIDVDGPRLTSFNGHVWEGPVMTADKKPTINNSSGLYCFKLKFARELQHSGYLEGPGDVASGFVELLGTVCEHDEGYRAEKMVVRRINLHRPVWKPLIAALEQRYKCDVVITNEKGERE